MYRRPYPPGIPDAHSGRSAHLHAVAVSPTFAAFPDKEREALFESLTKTLRRSEYHRLRYAALRSALEDRRANLPGQVFWDELVETLHFELQAFCGAARMALDEVVYIAARRHAVPPKKARRKPWETADLLKEPVPPECNVAEVALLRQKVDWFVLLNAYRNSVFHHGWTHGSGHFAKEDLRAAARDPSANALLVPDKASLGGRSKPHERTFNDGTTVDDVMRDAHDGLDEVLRELCEGPWATPEPTPGRVPRAEHPNIFVKLTTPALYVVHNRVLIPFFTTEEAARAFGPPGNGVELLAVPVVTSVVGRNAVTFTLNGLDGKDLPALQINVLVDPVVRDAGWTDIVCTAAIDVDVKEVVSKPTQPISLVVEANLKRLFVWHPTVA